MLGKNLLVLALAVCLAVPAVAMDSLNMPTGNGMKAGASELNFIYVNQKQKKNPAGQVKIDDMRYTKLFSGVSDRIQIDLDYLDIENAGDYWMLNGYYTVVKETPAHPSLILGATNITGEDWLGGRDFGGNPDYDDPSLFALAAYTLAKTKTPNLKTPVVRLHIGWGDNFHDEEFFGMLQVKVHPRVIGVIQNYKSMPTYVGTYQVTDTVQASVGTMDGNTFYRVGGVLKW